MQRVGSFPGRWVPARFRDAHLAPWPSSSGRSTTPRWFPSWTCPAARPTTGHTWMVGSDLAVLAIVAPLDGSEPSRRTMALAAALARRLGWRLALAPLPLPADAAGDRRDCLVAAAVDERAEPIACPCANFGPADTAGRRPAWRSRTSPPVRSSPYPSPRDDRQAQVGPSSAASTGPTARRRPPASPLAWPWRWTPASSSSTWPRSRKMGPELETTQAVRSGHPVACASHARGGAARRPRPRAGRAGPAALHSC